MKPLAIYPGTFDPLTFGHADLIYRAARLFDKLILAVSAHSRKAPLFSIEERLEMAKRLVKDIPNASVERFDGLLADYVRSTGACAVVRGLRAFSDFEYEFQMALTNRKLAPELETLFLMPKEEFSYISSSIVREISQLGGDTSTFAPDFVCEALKLKFSAKRKKDGRKS
jgi:pantetheine-phosphate adenylyltransferase